MKASELTIAAWEQDFGVMTDLGKHTFSNE